MRGIMLSAVTHVPSPALQDCELTFVESERIDYEQAVLQHRNYCKMLERCGVRVIILEENSVLPDSVFVEDPVIVFDEVAVLTSMGVESRRKERATLKEFFSRHRRVEEINLPARIEGGDVLKIGKRVFVGESPRTNIAGIRALEHIIAGYGYSVTPVKVSGCLHLKTGCTALDESTIIINPAWVDSSAFAEFKHINTLPGEPFGANVLRLSGNGCDTLCMNEAFPQTIDLVGSGGYSLVTTDISEFVKAEAGLTCMSVPFLAV